MKKTCLIITGGEIDLDFAGGFCKSHPFDKLIAVDGGLAPVKALGLVPDMIVGDLDTAEPSLVEAFKEFPYIIWDIHAPEKDETDTELPSGRPWPADAPISPSLGPPEAASTICWRTYSCSMAASRRG